MTPPADRFTCWVRFICGFLFFSIVIAVLLLRVMMKVLHKEFLLYGVFWLISTLASSYYLAC
ncbi:MAG: hypothetical protein ACON4K_09645 [Akkermansiaceae bacterium]